MSRRRRNRAMRSAGRHLEVVPSRRLPLPLGVRQVAVPGVRSRRYAAGSLFQSIPAKQVLRRSLLPAREFTTYAALRSLWMNAPSRVRFCVQRKQRREVLFAFRRAGFGGSAPKRHYRRDQDSQYSCERR